MKAFSWTSSHGFLFNFRYNILRSFSLVKFLFLYFFIVSSSFKIIIPIIFSLFLLLPSPSVIILFFIFVLECLSFRFALAFTILRFRDDIDSILRLFWWFFNRCISSKNNRPWCFIRSNRCIRYFGLIITRTRARVVIGTPYFRVLTIVRRFIESWGWWTFHFKRDR